MRIHIIACRVLTRELSYFAASSPHVVDITWLPQGMHDTPDLLRESVKHALNELYADVAAFRMKFVPDYICLGYGLCSNGVAGIESRDIPIIVPRTDDCIALFMGSQRKYIELFKRFNGTYWLNNGWVETSCGNIENQRALRKRKYDEYAEKYGTDNADYLMEQEDLWISKYNTCGFIKSAACPRMEYAEIAKQMAANNSWDYEEIDGDERMIRMLAYGEWNEREFLICPPYHRIEASFDENKIRAVKI